MILLAAAILAGLLAIGVLPPTWPVKASSRGGIATVQTVPIPEGPASVLFERNATGNRWALPLALIQPYIPDPLPAPLNQGLFCGLGGNLVVTFRDGSTRTYGPCRRPATIERLRWQMFAEQQKYCLDRCRPPTPS